ncbi:bifunctional diguanylate cyclase/phosphodiesterase [Marinomonas communis]|uniref:bifunctional diguanylate cyclase/phosphodiesterase n=1 Tax=Marinomonas communis TaxID=28254 RepID=UPI0010035633|nr:EAL domain-containing protein [Marinomonas communis]MCC4274850.1 EAL domain-containing protein [Marinomonas communis]RUM56348.1 MAG: GGDEF domain-containing protein [Marinomonas sp.]
MTLFRQLLLTIVLLLSLMLMVVMAINFQTTKNYLIDQLRSTTQDSATTLSMQISDFMALEDYTSVESTVNAVFDSGYFSQVRVHAYANDENIIRSNTTVISGVPQGFIDFIDFEVPTASAVISNGWNELGQVYVTGSAGYGYYQLWLATRDLLISFFAIGTVSVLLGGLMLRWLFKPLAEVEKQAEAIQQRRFIQMKTLPKTRELKSVVESMNRMAAKLEREFAAEAQTAQWLQAKAFKDPVSGLGNRNFFESQASAHFADTDRTYDGLMLISLIDLAKINNEMGYEAADNFIKSSAEILDRHLSNFPNATLARLNGADFVALVPNIETDRLKALVDAVMSDLHDLVGARISYSDAVANIGAVVIDASVDRSNAMAQADAALRSAKQAGPNKFSVFDSETGQQMAIGRMAWKEMLEHAIAHKSFALRRQAVASSHDRNKLLQQEIYASLEFENKQYHAGYFIGLAEQFDLGEQVDQVIIQRVIEAIQATSITGPFVVNLSASAYAKMSFVSWLDKTLQDLPDMVKSNLAFEVSEQSVLGTEDHAFLLAQTLKTHRVKFGIDNVGKQFSAFQYLQNLMPDYVKVDPSYTKLAVGKESESFFMHTLCKMFNSLNIDVIATGVETDQQVEILTKFDISGVQGYGIGRPVPFDE